MMVRSVKVVETELEQFVMSNSLFTGADICLGPVDMEKDPAVESRWTHDADYLRAFGVVPVRPRTAAQIKSRYQEDERAMDEKQNLFRFAIRAMEDDRLLGFARLTWLDWTHGSARLALAIGDPADRGKGYGTQALRLVLRYAFQELNLFRLSAMLPAYNEGAQRFFRQAGFTIDARRREALHRDNRRWDLLHMGLLRDEWEQAS